MKCLRLLAVLPIVLGISCATQNDRVAVSVYHLNSLDAVDKDNPTVRSEQQKRLYGAVSLKERQNRMGQYYTVRWNLDEQSIGAPVRVVFRYSQAATGSQELRQEHRVKEALAKGITEFSVAGDSYRNNGRVLNWKVEVYAEGKLIGSEQSFLWQ